MVAFNFERYIGSWPTFSVLHPRSWTRKAGGRHHDGSCHGSEGRGWWHELHGWFCDSGWNPQHDNLFALWTCKPLQVSVGFLDIIIYYIYWSIYPAHSTCSRFNTYPLMCLYDLKHTMKIKGTQQKFMATLVYNVGMIATRMLDTLAPEVVSLSVMPSLKLRKPIDVWLSCKYVHENHKMEAMEESEESIIDWDRVRVAG